MVRWRHSIKVLLQYSLTDLQFASERLARLRLPVSCCCNSSVHCSTGPQQNVDDDYCACRPLKAVRGRGLRGIHILGLPHSFLNRGLLEVNPAHLQLQQITHPQSGDEFE